MIGGGASAEASSAAGVNRAGAAEADPDSMMMQVCMAMSAATKNRTNQRIHM
ncbi:hypothetical protein [Nonomuraea dietziae]|uniref:hypothetical protein n=1 Tax=Nonomuraea dietziae TaxID=65515 RepID=UPI0034453AD9